MDDLEALYGAMDVVEPLKKFLPAAVGVVTGFVVVGTVFSPAVAKLPVIGPPIEKAAQFVKSNPMVLPVALFAGAIGFSMVASGQGSYSTAGKIAGGAGLGLTVLGILSALNIPQIKNALPAQVASALPMISPGGLADVGDFANSLAIAPTSMEEVSGVPVSIESVNGFAGFASALA